MTVRCIFCKDWKTDDPNCGHVLLDGILLPRLYATRSWIAKSEVGRGSYLDSENSGSQSRRIEHVTRQAAYALAGGWK